MRQLVLPLIIIAVLIVLAGCGVPYEDYKQAQDSKSIAQIIACLLGVGVVIALVVGTMIGSGARRNAQQ